MANTQYHTDRLTAIEERELVSLAQRGDENAMRRLVLSFHNLIEKYVRYYVRKFGAWNYVDDIRQDAIIGFMRGVSKFDVTFDNRLLTYVGYWVSASVRRAVVGIASTSYKENGVRRFAQFTSIDAPVGDGSSLLLSEVIEDVESMSQEDAKFASDVQDLIENILSEEGGYLSSRERDILRRRFMNTEKETLGQIATSYHITRERVRQIESKALIKVKKLLNIRYGRRVIDMFGDYIT